MHASTLAERRSIFIAALLAIALTAIAWGGVPWGTFQYDDFLNVVRDEATTDPAVLAERVQHGLRPLTRLSYFLDAHVFGLQAAGFLSTNLLLHLATVLLVFALARGRQLHPVGALIAALFFALQPANAEVVAYVSGRSTGLMTCLLLAGLLLHDRGQRIGALSLFALACLAKEVALVFPALVLAWEVTRPEPRPRVVREVLIATLVAGAVGALLLSIEGYQSLLSYSLALRSIGDNLLANGRAIPLMLSLWVRPWALSADHQFDAGNHVGVSVAGLLLLVLAMAAATALRRRRPMLALAIAWPLIALLPTNSLVAKIDLVTEKPLYLAWVGPSIALGAGVAALIASFASRTGRRMIVGATAVVLCALAGASAWRAAIWRDPVQLWTDATAKAPGKSRCWNNLGMANLVAHRDKEAVVAFEHAVLLDPSNQFAAMNLYTARALCGPACRP